MSSKNNLTYDELVERTQVELRQYYGDEYFEQAYGGDIYYGSYLELMEAMMPHHYSEGSGSVLRFVRGSLSSMKKWNATMNSLNSLLQKTPSSRHC